MALVSVWLHGGRVLAVPTGGHGLDIEPVGVCPPEPEAVGDTICAALEASAASPADLAPPSFGTKSPVLRAAGVRSYKALYRGAALCLVVEDEGQLTVELWQPARDGRGFEPSARAAMPIEDRATLGSVVLSQLT